MLQATIVIPNWNGMGYLPDCLSSLKGQDNQDFEILLVDNGSTDGSVDFVQTHYPEVKVISLEENTGFCHAVNLGIAHSRAPFVILLNNDTAADPGFVKELLACARRHPDAFSCQAKMVCMQDRQLMDDAGDLYCALGWAFARGQGKSAAKYRKEGRIFASCAGAALYRRSLFEEVGLFDERHFAYLEDVDVGYRAQLCGYANYFAPKALVAHAGSGASGSKHNAFKVRYSSRNSVYLIRKNMPLWQRLLNLPFFVAGFALKILFFWRKGLGRTYFAGLFEGLLMPAAKTRRLFGKTPLLRYWKVQLQLWGNLLLRLLG